MQIMLKEIRKRNSLTQAELAEMLGVKLPTYRTWERGTTMMNLEQAYNCAVVLNCTIDEIAGMPARGELDGAERKLVGDYRDTHDYFKPEISDFAERTAERHPKNEAHGDPRSAAVQGA